MAMPNTRNVCALIAGEVEDCLDAIAGQSWATPVAERRAMLFAYAFMAKALCAHRAAALAFKCLDELLRLDTAAQH